MNISRSIVCWVAALCMSACVAAGVSPSPEVDGSDEQLLRPRPCAEKACGTRCRQCPVNDPYCIETQVVKFCHADGSCSPQRPVCPVDPNPCTFTLCPVGTRCVVNPEDPRQAICEPIDKCALVRCRAGTHCVDGACIPDEPKVFCGGIAGFPCPGEGTCVDDPDDDCDPNHGGADCGGMCECAKTGECKPGSRWDPSPEVCACVADQPKVFCGGIAGFPCPGGGKCLDDPSDDCDPKNGGADCGGMCVCPASADCKPGTRWDPSPSVCACVPGAACGNRLCGPDQYCCNASCGICAPRGGGCIQIACGVAME